MEENDAARKDADTLDPALSAANTEACSKGQLSPLTSFGFALILLLSGAFATLQAAPELSGRLLSSLPKSLFEEVEFHGYQQAGGCCSAGCCGPTMESASPSSQEVAAD